jgi:hypothetical protein
MERAMRIEPVTVDSSGSIRMKENSVQLISVQLTVELHGKDKEKAGLPGLPIKGPVKTAK